MAYVDEKGQRYEFQYCVVLGNKDNGMRHYVWASEEEIRNAMDEIIERSPSLVGNELFYRDEQYEAKFNPKRIGSLEIKAKDFESAIRGFIDLSEKVSRA